VISGAPLQKQRSLGEVVSDTFSLFFANPAAYVVVSLPAAAVNAFFAIVGWTLSESVGAFALISLLSLPVLLVVHQVISAAVVAALLASQRGKPDAGQALAAAVDRFDDLVGAAVRSAVVVFLLCITIVGIPWGIWRAIRWAFIAQAVMVDGAAGDRVLQHSAEQVRGRWWGTFGRLIVMGMIVGIPVTGLAAAAGAALTGVLGPVLEALINTVATPIIAIGTTLVYFDLRARRQAATEAV
jgi:hypothetical protein